MTKRSLTNKKSLPEIEIKAKIKVIKRKNKRLNLRMQEINQFLKTIDKKILAKMMSLICKIKIKEILQKSMLLRKEIKKKR
jgi:hypothetical protein